MGDDLPDAVGAGEVEVSGDVGEVEGLSRAAAGIAGEELKGVCADGNGFLPHVEIARTGGEMAAGI